MAANEIHKGDIGTRITVTVKDDTSAVDISAATTKQIWLKKPSDTVLKKDATFTDDGSDGLMYYDTVDGDLDEIGDWKIQAYIVSSSGTWLSDISTMTVYANVE